METPEMVTGAVPVEVKTTGRVDDFPTYTFPKLMLVVLVLMLRVGTAAFNCSEKLFEILLAVAVNVTDCAELTANAFAVKLTLVALADTITDDGTVTPALLLERFTSIPPLGAELLSATVQASVPAPVIDALLQETALSVGKFEEEADPLPCSFTVAERLEVGLMILNCPVASVAALGLKCTFRLSVPPAARVRGKVLCPSMENEGSDRLRFEISTGAVPGFDTETCVLAELPTFTAPKSTELGDAARASVDAGDAVALTAVPPQPDIARQNETTTITRAMHQILSEEGR
jgi:hypothetical protein